MAGFQRSAFARGFQRPAAVPTGAAWPPGAHAVRPAADLVVSRAEPTLALALSGVDLSARLA